MCIFLKLPEGVKNMLIKLLLSIIWGVALIIASAIIMIVFKTSVDNLSPSNGIIIKNENSNDSLIIYRNCRSEFPREITKLRSYR